MEATKLWVVEQVAAAGGSIAYSDLRANAPYEHVRNLPRAIYSLQADGKVNPVTAYSAEAGTSFVIYAIGQEA